MRDIYGIEHEVGMQQDEGFGHIQPDQTIHYDGGLKHYLIDGREVPPAEFFRLFPNLTKA